MTSSDAVVDLAVGEQPWYLRSSRVHRYARRLVHGRLRRLRVGRLRLVETGRIETFGGPSRDGLEAGVHVMSPRFYGRVAFRGALGAAESYVLGEWDAEDLASVVRVLVRNREALVGLEGSWGRLAGWIDRAFHRRRANTRDGSRRNIGAHYDLGDDFFATFLDPTMMYSSAVFPRPNASLEEASTYKIDRLCRALRLGPEDHLLEIGTGWGGLAVHAADRYGCRVTTTTISAKQHAFATERVAQAGLGDRVTVLARDYRDLEGTFDKLVSVEMIEAVGEIYLDGFFEVCAARLAPGGLMALQAITIADRHFARARRNVDFIQRYIFPGSFIPSLGALAAASARTDLDLVRLDDIGAHYAETLRRWALRFEDRRAEVRAQGFSERFVRLWRYYLAYCEGGFRERSISDVQAIYAKPGCAHVPTVGALS